GRLRLHSARQRAFAAPPRALVATLWVDAVQPTPLVESQRRWPSRVVARRTTADIPIVRRLDGACPALIVWGEFELISERRGPSELARKLASRGMFASSFVY